jgi:inositol phosphorylceramide synthase catalytic subunit
VSASQKFLFPLIWALYLIMVHFTMGLRAEHFAVVGLILVCFFAHAKSRHFILSFMPFVLFALLYDLLRIIPKSWAGTIHIRELVVADQKIFEWLGFGPNFLPTDFFHNNHHIVLDLLCAGAYSLHILIPIGFGLILWKRKSNLLTLYCWGFFFMNIMAFATYVLYPAAPPWYVTLHGFENLGWDTIGHAAGLMRVDAWLGTPYFQNTYERGSWVFGAVPSMHAGFPVLVALFARRTLGNGRYFFYGFMVLVNFAAVYLEHHYVIDLILGWGYATITYGLLRIAGETK